MLHPTAAGGGWAGQVSMSQVGQSGDNVCDISKAAGPDLTSPGISLLQQWPQVCKSELLMYYYKYLSKILTWFGFLV